MAWDWKFAANPGLQVVTDTSFPILVDLPFAGASAPNQGISLGRALSEALGADYDNKLHLLGHSLGTRVNKNAADFLHIELDPENTHVTIFDAAEAPIENYLPWSNPIPEEAGFIENYVTAFGQTHEEAVNVLLFEDLPTTIGILDIVNYAGNFHSRPHQWYGESIVNPDESAMGFSKSFLNGDAVFRPTPNSHFVQVDGQGPLGLGVAEATNFEAASLILARDLRIIGGVATTVAVGAKASSGVKLKGLVGSVGNVAVSTTTNSVLDGVIEAIDAVLNEQSPAYAWIPLELPSDADFMRFDVKFSGMSDIDSFAIGINDFPLVTQTGAFMPENEYVSFEGIDVSYWSNQEVELFLGLLSDGDAGGQLDFRNIEFYSVVPEPSSLSLVLAVLLMACPGRQRR